MIWEKRNFIYRNVKTHIVATQYIVWKCKTYKMLFNTRVSAPQRVTAVICVYVFHPSNIELRSGIQVLLLYIWEYFDGAYLNISHQSTVTSSQIKNDAISHAIRYNREVTAKQSNGAMLLF